MRPISTSASQDGLSGLAANLHKLMGAEVALEVYLLKIEQTATTVLLAALQAQCKIHRAEVLGIINDLGEMLTNTPVGPDVASAFMQGNEIIETVHYPLQQLTMVAVLTQCHIEIIDMVKEECISTAYPNDTNHVLLGIISKHFNMQSDMLAFAR